MPATPASPGVPETGGPWASRVGRLALGPGEVLTVRRVGDLRLVSVAHQELAELVRPGQLVSLAPPDPSVRVRTAVPVAGASRRGTYGGTIELLLGPGDAGPLAPRDRFEVVGPLGRAVRWPSEPGPVVVLGVGRGGGLATWLAENLRGRGCRVELVLAAPTSTLLADVVHARRAGRVAVATADGTAGSRGDGSALVAERAEGSGAGLVYAVGPLRELVTTAEAAAALGVVAQCVVDDAVPCVTGACGSCAVPVVDAGGDTVLARPCVEGPSLPGDRIRWDAVGPAGRRVPGDTLAGRRPRR